MSDQLRFSILAAGFVAAIGVQMAFSSIILTSFGARSRPTVWQHGAARGLAFGWHLIVFSTLLPWFRVTVAGLKVELPPPMSTCYWLSDTLLQLTWTIVPLFLGLFIADILLFRRLRRNPCYRSFARWYSAIGTLGLAMSLVYVFLMMYVVMVKP